MINIPISVYKSLLEDSVNLQKFKVNMEKLKNFIHKQAAEIKKLQKRKNVCAFIAIENNCEYELNK